MEKRLVRLEIVYRRVEARHRAPREEPIDWRQVPDALPACFAALTADEQAEWAELMIESSAPGAWQRHKGDRGFYQRLAELDNKIDWRVGEAPLWPVR